MRNQDVQSNAHIFAKETNERRGKKLVLDFADFVTEHLAVNVVPSTLVDVLQDLVSFEQRLELDSRRETTRELATVFFFWACRRHDTKRACALSFATKHAPRLHLGRHASCLCALSMRASCTLSWHVANRRASRVACRLKKHEHKINQRQRHAPPQERRARGRLRYTMGMIHTLSHTSPNFAKRSVARHAQHCVVVARR